MQWALPQTAQKLLFRTVGRDYDPYTDWNSRYRAIFIHVPRTGGTSIARAINAPKPHVPIGRYQLFDARRFDAYFKFAFVRNPWDRLLSSYSHIRAIFDDSPEEGLAWAPPEFAYYQSFETFVLALEYSHFRSRMLAFDHFRPQLDWIGRPRSKTVPLDFVGRFERLGEDFAAATRIMGIDAALPLENESRHGPYRECFSSKMRDVVGNVYSDDVSILDYRF
jgi:hypothetical protein